MERNATQEGCAIRVAPSHDCEGVAWHQVAWVEGCTQCAHDGVHGHGVDAVTLQNARDRLIAPHGHGAAVALERHFGQRDGLSERNGGAARPVPAFLGAGSFDVSTGPRLDADRNRNAPTLALRLEQKPHLAADRHAPQVGLLLNCPADSVDVNGAHAGPGKQDGEAVAAS